MRMKEGGINMNLKGFNWKKVGGTVVLIFTACGAFMDVINDNQKEKDFENMKKKVEQLEKLVSQK